MSPSIKSAQIYKSSILVSSIFFLKAFGINALCVLLPILDFYGPWLILSTQMEVNKVRACQSSDPRRPGTRGQQFTRTRIRRCTGGNHIIHKENFTVLYNSWILQVERRSNILPSPYWRAREPGLLEIQLAHSRHPESPLPGAFPEQWLHTICPGISGRERVASTRH